MGPDVAGKIILIAGGVGKGADFSDLVGPLSRYGKHTLLVGEDAQHIAQALADKVTFSHAIGMQEALTMAHGLAVSGDLVLLSPACASFDAYTGFEARGDHFAELVRTLL